MKEKAKEAGFDTTSEWELVVWHEHTSKGSSNNTRSTPKTNKMEDGIFPIDLDEKELNKPNHYPLEGYRFHYGNDVLYLYVGKYNGSGNVFCEIYLKKTSDILRGKLSSSIPPEFEDHSDNKNRKYYIYKETSPDAKAKMEPLKEAIAHAIWDNEADKYLHPENS